jgi:hypothetical protein
MLLFSCNSTKKEGINAERENCISSKIKFKLANFDKQGFLREDDLKNPIDYEFCIPNTAEALNKIKEIDSSIKPTKSKGRTKCKEGYVLMMGNSYGKDIKKILCNLSQLEYVTGINRVYWE